MKQAKNKVNNTAKKLLNKLIALVGVGYILGSSALWTSTKVGDIDPKWKLIIGVIVISAIVYIIYKTYQDSK